MEIFIKTREFKKKIFLEKFWQCKYKSHVYQAFNLNGSIWYSKEQK